MKTLFKSVFSLLAVATLCLSALSSCKGEDEVYDFVFDIPGSIVTEPGATIEMPFTACNVTSISTSSKPEGWTVKNIDMKEWIITIAAPDKYASEDNSIEENGTLTDFAELKESRLKCRCLTPARSQRTATADRRKVA